MNREVRAIIRWVPASRGGRSRPPHPAAGYAAPARFESDLHFVEEAWSLRIVRSSELHGPEVIDARVRFVMDDAPHAVLSTGERFELLEGRKVVAKGVVLPETLPAPQEMTEFELALLG